MLDTEKENFDKILSDISRPGSATYTSKNKINFFQYNERDTLYTDLLNNYIEVYKDQSQDNRKYKKWFFWIIMGMFALVIGGAILSMIFISSKGEITPSYLGMMIAAVSSIISVVIVLPKVIAEHLFPKDAETHIINLVERMQKNDTQIRNTNKGEQ